MSSNQNQTIEEKLKNGLNIPKSYNMENNNQNKNDDNNQNSNNNDLNIQMSINSNGDLNYNKRGIFFIIIHI